MTILYIICSWILILIFFYFFLTALLQEYVLNLNSPQSQFPWTPKTGILTETGHFLAQKLYYYPVLRGVNGLSFLCRQRKRLMECGQFHFLPHLHSFHLEIFCLHYRFLLDHPSSRGSHNQKQTAEFLKQDMQWFFIVSGQSCKTCKKIIHFSIDSIAKMNK